jgi:hypothetical protein
VSGARRSLYRSEARALLPLVAERGDDFLYDELASVLNDGPLDEDGDDMISATRAALDRDVQAEALLAARHLVIGTPGFDALTARAAELRKAPLPTQPGRYVSAQNRDAQWELDEEGLWWFRGYPDRPHPTPHQQDRTPADVMNYGMPLRKGSQS